MTSWLLQVTDVGVLLLSLWPLASITPLPLLVATRIASMHAVRGYPQRVLYYPDSTALADVCWVVPGTSYDSPYDIIRINNNNIPLHPADRKTQTPGGFFALDQCRSC